MVPVKNSQHEKLSRSPSKIYLELDKFFNVRQISKLKLEHPTMTQITEIAPDLYRISTFIPEANLQFNQFLVRDEQPLLFHTA